MARDSMLQPLADPVTLHQPSNDRLSSGTAERDTLSCAAPVQAALQEGISLSYMHDAASGPSVVHASIAASCM